MVRASRYAGYSIVDLAAKCVFEEIAHLLIYGMFDCYQHHRDHLECLIRIVTNPRLAAQCRAAECV